MTHAAEIALAAIDADLTLGDRLVLEFTARGQARGQGSIHALPSRGAQRQGKGLNACMFSEVVLTSDSKDLRQWRAMVRTEARTAIIRRHAQARIRPDFNTLRDVLWPTGPVRMICIWHLPRPVRLKADAPLEHCTRPDLDKLERALLDALTGALYTDDGQVQTMLKQKFVAAPDQAAGVEVTAWQ